MASHVVASRRIFSFPLFLFLSSPGALDLFFFIPLAVFVAGVSLFLSFFLSFPFARSLSLSGKGSAVVEMGNYLDLRDGGETPGEIHAFDLRTGELITST